LVSELLVVWVRCPSSFSSSFFFFLDCNFAYFLFLYSLDGARKHRSLRKVWAGGRRRVRNLGSIRIASNCLINYNTVDYSI
jgi:hypothetical protein